MYPNFLEPMALTSFFPNTSVVGFAERRSETQQSPSGVSLTRALSVSGFQSKLQPCLDKKQLPISLHTKNPGQDRHSGATV